MADAPEVHLVIEPGHLACGDTNPHLVTGVAASVTCEECRAAPEFTAVQRRQDDDSRRQDAVTSVRARFMIALTKAVRALRKDERQRRAGEADGH